MNGYNNINSYARGITGRRDNTLFGSMRINAYKTTAQSQGVCSTFPFGVGHARVVFVTRRAADCHQNLVTNWQCVVLSALAVFRPINFLHTLAPAKSNDVRNRREHHPRNSYF